MTTTLIALASFALGAASILFLDGGPKIHVTARRLIKARFGLGDYSPANVDRLVGKMSDSFRVGLDRAIEQGRADFYGSKRKR